MFFRNDFQEPPPDTDQAPPEKTGAARFFEILQGECGNLIKINLFFLLTCLPLITIPPAVYALNQVVHSMVLDQSVHGFSHYWSAFRQHLRQAYISFFLMAVPLFLSGYGAWFYLRYAGENPLLFLPFMFCSTVFLVTLLASAYLYGILSAGTDFRSSLRLSLALGIGRPFRALVAAVFCYGLILAAVLAFPLSLVYLLLIGFSLPCLLSHFFTRTVIRQYCGGSHPT